MATVKEKANILLDLIVSIVDEKEIPWEQRRDIIDKMIEENTTVKEAFVEFFGWFLEEKEPDPGKLL